MGVALTFDVAEVAHQLGPAREPVLARDDELRVREVDTRRCGRVERGVPRAGARAGVGVAGAQPAEQGFRRLTLELEARPRWEGAQPGHTASFRYGPRPRGGPEK